MTNRILIMDDDETICTLCGLLLNRLGYEADSTTSGEEALVAYDRALKAGTPYRGVILDLTVKQGMGGLAVIPKLRELDPHVYAIVASGASVESLTGTYKSQGFDDILPKPFRLQDMSDCLQRMKSSLA
jgi:two-component system, cell cycle sensor histidine kinase and response regulator CckA